MAKPRWLKINQADNYDNPQDVDILEEQGRIIPHGPIGYAFPKVEVTQAVPAEFMDALGKCLNGEILPTQVAEMITAYLVRQIKKPVAPLVP